MDRENARNTAMGGKPEEERRKDTTKGEEKERKENDSYASVGV